MMGGRRVRSRIDCGLEMWAIPCYIEMMTLSLLRLVIVFYASWANMID